MNTKRLVLTFEIQSDWHIGSGEEGGAYADALVVKDAQGLPFIPGKSVKGLLRDAFNKAAAHDWFGNSLTANDVFGAEGVDISTQSKVAVSSAELSLAEQTYLNAKPVLKTKLFRVLHNTAIDHKSGVAADMSLRAIEVTVPMTLTSTVNALVEIDESILDQIGKAARLIQEVGAKRNRGLGEVIVSYELKDQELI